MFGIGLGYLAGDYPTIVPLDDEGKWYRYHHLFAELLRYRLHHLYSEQVVATLHRAAGQWRTHPPGRTSRSSPESSMKITRVEPILIRTPMALDDAVPHAGGAQPILRGRLDRGFAGDPCLPASGGQPERVRASGSPWRRPTGLATVSPRLGTCPS